jgi:copper chaperone
MLRFHVPNMTCGGCAKSVTKALQSVDSKARIETESSIHEVRIENTVDERSLLAALEAAGYPAQRHTEITTPGRTRA